MKRATGFVAFRSYADRSIVVSVSAIAFRRAGSIRADGPD
jgi:hypothetical protein